MDVLSAAACVPVDADSTLRAMAARLEAILGLDKADIDGVESGDDRAEGAVAAAELVRGAAGVGAVTFRGAGGRL